MQRPMTRVLRRSSACAIAGLLTLAASPGVAQVLTVHEWGTITTRHAADGTPQGRLNRIEAAEVLPAFVHRFEPVQSRSDPYTKSPTTRGRTDVTMRLETPVIYFYGGGGETFDVKVQMRGGILNEFYPAATATLTGDPERLHAKIAAKVLDPNEPINLNNYLVGELDWTGVALDAAARVPKTNAAIWTAPRKVAASKITVGGEGEHYLFYRGVAHLDALLRTEHSEDGVRLSAPRNLQWLQQAQMTIPRVWVVDVRADGTLAFATDERLDIAKSAPSALLSQFRPFAAGDYGASQAAALRQSMKSELIAAGLFDDEAEAMLTTWSASYFRGSGLRVFYVVPRVWIDYFLPLELSVPHDATRVLIGRIDLLTQTS